MENENTATTTNLRKMNTRPTILQNLFQLSAAHAKNKLHTRHVQLTLCKVKVEYSWPGQGNIYNSRK